MTKFINTMHIAFSLALGSLALEGKAFAEIYKCTNSSGSVSYQQIPCQDAGEKMSTIKPLPLPSSEDQKRAEERTRQLEAHQEERRNEQQAETQAAMPKSYIPDDNLVEINNRCVNEADDKYKYFQQRYAWALDLCNAGLTSDEMVSCISKISSGNYSRSVIQSLLQHCILTKKH